MGGVDLTGIYRQCSFKKLNCLTILNSLPFGFFIFLDINFLNNTKRLQYLLSF